MNYKELNKDDEKFEELRKILEKENGIPYTLEQARRIGQDMLDYYRLLAQGKKVVMSTPAEFKRYKRQLRKRFNSEDNDDGQFKNDRPKRDYNPIYRGRIEENEKR